jgi:ribosomal subunit interface protein
MKINFTFRHMDASDRIRNHTAEKLERLERFEDRELTIDAVFSAEKFHRTAEFKVHGDHGTVVMSETREDMFEAIDVAVDRLDHMLAREKDKRKHHKGGDSLSTQETV